MALVNVSNRSSETAPKSLTVYRPTIRPAEISAGRSWGKVIVRKTLRWLEPSPVAASSVAGSIWRKAGTRIR